MEKPLVPSALVRAVERALEEANGERAGEEGDQTEGGVPIDWDAPMRE